MIKTFFSVLSCLVLMFAVNTHAAGDPVAGKQKAAICAACHGPDGNSLVPMWPSIAGQHEAYFLKQMKDIQSGTRIAEQMKPIIGSMSEQDFEDLAAFYASQEPKPGEAAPENIESGEKLYRTGNSATGLAACMACHGPSGAGDPAALFPRLSGQHAQYTVATLKAYRTAAQANDQNAMMRDIAAKMSDAEIEAVANYIMGLH
jgi:cytochrome c553